MNKELVILDEWEYVGKEYRIVNTKTELKVLQIFINCRWQKAISGRIIDRMLIDRLLQVQGK